MWLRAIYTLLRIIGNTFLKKAGIYNTYKGFKWLYKGIKSKNIKKFYKYFKNIGIKQMKKVPLFRFIQQGAKYGFKKEIIKTSYEKLTPIEIKKINWYIKLLLEGLEVKRKLVKEYYAKTTFGKNIKISGNTINVSKVPTKITAENIQQVIRSRPKEEQARKQRNELLRSLLVFFVKSPERHCFDVAPQTVSLKYKLAIVPMKSELPPTKGQVKRYIYTFPTMSATGKYYSSSVRTKNWGKNIYSQMRSPLPPSRARAIAKYVYGK